MRYDGMLLPALLARFTGTGSGHVQAPVAGPLRTLATSFSNSVSELQLNPIPVRRVASLLSGGAPTFYFQFMGAGTLPDPSVEFLNAADLLAVVPSVVLAAVSQDRVWRDPGAWTRAIANALPDGQEKQDWQAFADTVAQALSGAWPLWLLDHAGQPLDSASIELRSDNQAPTPLDLTPADGSNLLLTYSRSGASTPLWSLTRPRLALSTGSPRVGSVQFAVLEDTSAAIDEVAISPERRHIQIANLERWYAPQSVAASPLLRWSRGNALTVFVNGKEFFDTWFRLAYQARSGGVHMAGWEVFAQAQLTQARDGEVNQPLSLVDLAKTFIGNGAGRFLLSKHYQLDDPGYVTDEAAISVAVFVMALASYAEVKHLEQFHSDLLALVPIAAGLAYGLYKIDDIVRSHGDSIESSLGQFFALPDSANCVRLVSKHPSTWEDNPFHLDSSGQNVFPIDLLKDFLTHYGVFHQKLSALFIPTPGAADDRQTGRHLAFCGGMDFNADRLDDAGHLAPAPFHDVHAQVEGPAARDLMLTFEERWRRETVTADLAFPTPTSLPDAGEVILQFARTYPQPAANATAERILPFAPAGDHTLHDTLLAAIGQARQFIYIEDQYLTPHTEYQDVLRNALDRIDKLIITCPNINDQPLGDVPRSEFVKNLLTWAPAKVRVGFPRRHLTLPDKPSGSDLGRALLVDRLDAGTGVDNVNVVLQPAARVPDPPFWIACEGELMWAYDKGTLPAGRDPGVQKAMLVVRGDNTGLTRAPRPTTFDLTPRSHDAGAPVVIVEFSNIYVHAKLTIIDDVFLSLGSANLNRRGLFHDGELNLFALPQRLRAGGPNPIADLRRRLWAEWLDLPEAIAGPLLVDPVGASALFDRPLLAGTRHIPFDVGQPHAPSAVNGTMGLLVAAIAPALAVPGNLQSFYDIVVDPTTGTRTP
jgi:phosphatidylserine/phosphatidylglycerophosphate/cardiolipin synthase-like enzyme